jgi:pilus assembly protein Flp/PilA
MLKLFVTLQAWFATKADEERGATAVEYGLMVALIAVAIIVTVTALGGRLNGTFQTVRDALPGGAPAAP